MVEQEVEVIVLAVDDDMLLPADEGEAGAEFEDEVLEFAEDGDFEILFAVGISEAEEVQEVGIAKDQIRGERILLA